MNTQELSQFSQLLNTLKGGINHGTIRLMSLSNVKEEVLSMEEDTFKNNYGKPICTKKETQLKDSCRLILNKDMFQQLQEYHRFFKETENLYFTPNIFKYSGTESKENVTYLTALFADIDHVTVEEGLSRLENSQLPEPSFGLSSGHGVHFYWVLTYKLLPTEGYIKSWLKVQKFITNQLNSDSSVDEISRYMRIPLSTNNKEDTPIKSKIIIDNLNRMFDFREDFYDKFCKSQEKFDPFKYKKSSSKEKKNTRKTNKQVTNHYADFLSKDIHWLLEKRVKEGYQWNGIRHNTLLALKCLKYTEEYLRYVNNTVFEEPLSSTELNHIISYQHKFDFITREKVFNFLQVTESEEKNLKVLVNEDEAQVRKLIKKLDGKYRKLLKESVSYCKINYIKTATQTKINKEVAKKMTLSERDVTRFNQKEYSVQLKNSIIKTQIEDIMLSLDIIETTISERVSIENLEKMDELGKKIVRVKELMLKDDELTSKNKFKMTILLKKYKELQALKEG